MYWDAIIIMYQLTIISQFLVNSHYHETPIWIHIIHVTMDLSVNLKKHLYAMGVSQVMGVHPELIIDFWLGFCMK